MKKETILTLIVYSVMIGIALFVGLNIIAPAFVILGITGNSQYVYAIITIVAAFLINVLFLELGHVLGAWLGGYRIQAINILGLALVFDQEGIKFRFQSYEGLTGETTITAKRKKVYPRLFLFGGLFTFFFVMLVSLVVGYGLFSEDQWGRYASVVVIAVGGMLMIYNFMPFKLDTVTDGYRLASLTTAKGSEAQQELQRIELAYKKGEVPSTIKSFKDVNTITTQIYFHKIYQALVDEQYKEALKDILTIHKTPRLTEAMGYKLMVLKTFVYFMTHSVKLNRDHYYQLTSKERKYLSHNASMSTLSTYLYVAGIIEESQSEASYTFERQRVAIKKINEPGRKAAETILFDRVLKLVKKSNPSWRLS